MLEKQTLSVRCYFCPPLAQGCHRKLHVRRNFVKLHGQVVVARGRLAPQIWRRSYQRQFRKRSVGVYVCPQLVCMFVLSWCVCLSSVGVYVCPQLFEVHTWSVSIKLRGKRDVCLLYWYVCVCPVVLGPHLECL